MANQKKSRDDSERDILHRAARIEGQMKAIQRMIVEKRKCMDVVTQILAVRSALSMLGIELLKDDLLCHPPKNSIDEAYIQKLFTLH